MYSYSKFVGVIEQFISWKMAKANIIQWNICIILNWLFEIFHNEIQFGQQFSKQTNISIRVATPGNHCCYVYSNEDKKVYFKQVDLTDKEKKIKMTKETKKKLPGTPI